MAGPATRAEIGSFDVCGPLPTGTTLLEASAGTGKTFTVGALVTRYVAEGVAQLHELLVITFGRAASQELRERVRAQLVAAERALADPATADRDNTLIDFLLRDGADHEAMRHRLTDALATFDSATIATTHQFCQIVLRSLGVAGDTDAGATLVESLDELVVEVVDDVYLATYGAERTPPPFDRDTALALARTAVEDPQSALAPADPDDVGGSARVAFAEAVRAEVDRRKRRLGILSYDDLLSRLATALEPLPNGDDAPARARMRRRWRIVLVDEFQDTDPVQWDVLDRAFTGHATMVLIGDPKQAIYGFRGGDVVTYLDAARTAATQATLGTNRRSDDALVRRLQVVLEGAALGHPDIVVRSVTAHHRGARLTGAPRPSPLRLRQVRRDGFRLTRAGLIPARDARAFIAEDCAADIATLLDAGATWCGEDVRAGQVAAIVATRAEGQLVQRALAARGIPAVMSGGGDVFLTPAGDAWLALLQALESPHRSGLVRAAALTCFLGLTAAELDAGGEELTGRIADTLRGWALLVRGRGVAALVEAAEERGLTSRVLGEVEGERLLTDVRHLGQLLHEVSLREGLGLTALLGWFRDERRRTGATERPRRLDSDAAAVQIVTVHGSKGLEYPIVYLPFAYQYFPFPSDVARFHDDSSGRARRTLDVTGSGAAWPEHVARHQAEELGEEMRELYVALTRAQSQVVAWWAPTTNTPTGPLHRLLFGRRPGDPVVPDQMDVRDDEYVARVLDAIAELGGPTHELAEVAPPVPAPAVEPVGALAARSFDRAVDTAWRRTSYSGLIRVEEAAPGPADHVGSEPEVGAKDDDETGDPGGRVASASSVETPLESLLSPMAGLPAGATFGSLVHAVLEHTDPDAPDLRDELLRHVTEQLRWWPVDASPEELADGLLPLNHTPLGPLADGLTLARIPLRDRLRELDFEFPLAGGDTRTATAEIRLRDIAGVLREHLPHDDPLRPYVDRLDGAGSSGRLLGDQALRGYLSGSVDVVLRLPSGRFVVVDYKTNLLGDQTAADYAPDRLAEAMLHSHYPLQALLYSVVTHRFLRWRLPGYDPATHLGGVLYLYVRGMLGPDTPLVDGHPTGVFSWQPSAALVVALSDLLDGGDGP
ncbi:exodeoxyribonuclease V subunit beta [Nocardioides panacihumi]|uniref:RecBCD enzyme subunit RecB n=1 Tax=Nocardioides panacihumi TaxID=400774 RepID=A0ABN2QCS0_9ACTN